MLQIRLNLSTVYLLPMSLIPPEWFKGFIEAYCGCKLRNYSGCIYLLFYKDKLQDINRYKTVSNLYVEHFYINKNIIECEENDKNAKFAMLVYKVPSFFIDDYNNILVGKYSNVSERYYTACINFTGSIFYQKIYNLAFRPTKFALNKKQTDLNTTIDLTETEDIFNMEEEIFPPRQLVNYVNKKNIVSNSTHPIFNRMS